ncbi:MAG TPA: DUF3738 domain-containing protein [Bryobacteraceae bacterium]|jgi:uncharacterized protein (TIGR03435 family)|nr:DUF3738 domain-containing protein [Bryobacteraceae bacterium]
MDAQHTGILGLSTRPIGTDIEALTDIEVLKEQLGLKLESTRGTVQVPVVDRVERTDEN